MVNIKSAPPTLPFDTPVTGMGGGRMRDAVHYFKIKQGKKLKIIINNGNKGIITSQQSKTPEWDKQTHCAFCCELSEILHDHIEWKGAFWKDNSIFYYYWFGFFM